MGKLQDFSEHFAAISEMLQEVNQIKDRDIGCIIMTNPWFKVIFY